MPIGADIPLKGREDRELARCGEKGAESYTIVGRATKKGLIEQKEISSKNFHIIFYEAYNIGFSLLLQSLL